MADGNRNTAIIVLVILLVAASGLGIIVCCGGVGVFWFMARTSGDAEAVTPPNFGDMGDVQAESTPGDEAFTNSIAVDTEYFLGGPQQAQPPDGTFTAGTKVKWLEEAGSYCLVESEDGVRAYVAADALTPLDSGK